MQNITKRLIGWAIIVAALLMIPLVAMRFTTEVNWTLSDFIFAGGLVFGTGLTYELVSRKGGTAAYRAAVGLALGAAFLLIWINGAVGIIGSEGNDANLLYFGVIAILFIGSIIADLEPQGMSRALFATAFVQVLIPIIVLIGEPGVIFTEPPGVLGVFILNTFFAALFVGSAMLFRRASATISV